MTNRKFLTAFAFFLATLFAAAHADELGAIDQDVKVAFGFTLGQVVNDTASNLVTTSELGRYKVIPAEYPIGIDRIEISLTALSKRLQLLSATGKFDGAAACNQFVEEAVKQAKGRLQMRVARGKYDKSIWTATKGTTEREYWCDGSSFHFVLRDDLMNKLGSRESEDRLNSVVCDLPAAESSARPVSIEVFQERFSPLRKVTPGDLRVPLGRIATRMQTFYNRVMRRASCINDTRLGYSVVLDANGRAIDIAPLAGNAGSSTFNKMTEQEIRRERFGAVEGEGYRLVEFAMRMAVKP